MVLRCRSPWGWPSVGLPRAAGSRWLSSASCVCLLASLGSGRDVSLSPGRSSMGGQPPFATISGEFARLDLDREPAARARLPLVGTGLGSFGTIYPYVKTHDASLTTAMSSVLQCAVESGAVGLGILAVAALWCLCRLPGCLEASRLRPTGRSHTA